MIIRKVDKQGLHFGFGKDIKKHKIKYADPEVMRWSTIFTLIVLLLSGCNEGSIDNNCITIQLSRGYPDDSIHVKIDNSINYSVQIKNLFYISPSKRMILVDKACFENDSMKVNISINKIDTTFYVHSNVIKSIVCCENNSEIEIKYEYINPDSSKKDELGFE